LRAAEMIDARKRTTPPPRLVPGCRRGAKPRNCQPQSLWTAHFARYTMFGSRSSLNRWSADSHAGQSRCAHRLYALATTRVVHVVRNVELVGHRHASWFLRTEIPTRRMEATAATSRLRAAARTGR
jgi:hypothetical protein